MSSPSTPSPSPSLLTTIETDLSAAGAWLKTELVDDATVVWNVLKTTFYAVTVAQGKIVIDLLEEIEADVLAGKSIEEIETDLLGMAEGEELEALEGIASSDIQAIIASFKSTKAAA